MSGRCTDDGDPNTTDISTDQEWGGISEGTINLIDAVDGGNITGPESGWISDDYYTWDSGNQAEYLDDLEQNSGQGKKTFKVQADDRAGTYRDAHSRRAEVSSVVGPQNGPGLSLQFGVCPVFGCVAIGIRGWHPMVEGGIGLAVSPLSVSVGIDTATPGAYEVNSLFAEVGPVGASWDFQDSLADGSAQVPIGTSHSPTGGPGITMNGIKVGLGGGFVHRWGYVF